MGTGPISFDMSTPQLTRSDATTAGKLGNNFVVFGFKTNGSTTQTVFDNYQVNWATNTAGTSETNSADWEYVGNYKNLPYGTTTTSGGTLNSDGVAKNATDATTNIIQSIKYWDFAGGTEYNFIAYSLGVGDGSTPTYAKASAITTTGFTLEGSATELGACYISNKKKITPASSTPEVQLEFVNFLSKIQLKFYETIPGYAVKDLKFYTVSGSLTDSDNSGDADGLVPALYGADGSIKKGGKYTITYADNGNPDVAFTSGEGYTHTNEVDFAAISGTTYLNNYASTLDYHEAATPGEFLSRESTNATSTSQITVLPNSNGATLTLKIDYTLVSRDGNGETIQVTGKTAIVPAAYTQWKSNYAYTYLFKITDDKLVPITLDAVIIDNTTGTQETITTVADPSITTYQNGSTNLNEYDKNKDIFVVVEQNGLKTLTNDGSTTQNTWIYSFGTTAKTESEVISALNIQDEVPSGNPAGTILGRNSIMLTPLTKVTDASSYGDDKWMITNKVDKGVDGKEITVGDNKVAKFKPNSAGYYAFVYYTGTGDKPSETKTTHYGEKTFAADASVEGYYRYFTIDATTGDAQDGITYYSQSSGAYSVASLFTGQPTTNIYIYDSDQYKPAADDKVKTSVTNYYYATAVTTGTYKYGDDATSLYTTSAHNETATGTIVAGTDYYDGEGNLVSTGQFKFGESVDASAYLCTKSGDNYVPFTGSIVEGTTYYKITEAVRIAHASFGSTTLYTTNVGEGIEKTETTPDANTIYYQRTGDSAPYTFTRCVILPEQSDGKYKLVDTPSTPNACASGEKAIDGQKYYDKYEAYNNTYAVKVIKVQ